MAFVSITRLKVRSVFYLIRFLLANEASAKQLTRTKGFLGGTELIDKSLTFWTLTLWDVDADMKVFRNSAHRKAMQKLPLWCSEASYFHWHQVDAILPSLNDASGKLLKEGKLTKVRNPSANQIANSFPPVKWKRSERNFKPFA